MTRAEFTGWIARNAEATWSKWGSLDVVLEKVKGERDDWAEGQWPPVRVRVVIEPIGDAK